MNDEFEVDDVALITNHRSVIVLEQLWRRVKLRLRLLNLWMEALDGAVIPEHRSPFEWSAEPVRISVDVLVVRVHRDDAVRAT